MNRANRGERTVVIIGGGVTGLAAAHRLHELSRAQGSPLRVHLLESSRRLGGTIRTERVGDYLLEAGPDQFVRHKPAGVELCRRLGLEDRLVEINAGSATAQVVRHGRPISLPDGFSMMGPTRLMPLLRSPLLSLRGKLRVAIEPWISPPDDPPEDESLCSFITRRFGREMHERVFEPILAGIFTADADRMSLQMAMPRLLQLERRHGSLLKAFRSRGSERGGGPSGCLTLRGGLGLLVSTLVDRIPAGWVRTSCAVQSIRSDRGTGRWLVAHAGGGRLVADSVILACPAHVSVRLLRPADRELADELGRLEYASCATVNLAYPATAIGRTLSGFGFFVGRSERLPILACSHVSNKYPERVPKDSVVLRAFVGGARNPEALDRDDEALAQMAHRTLARLLRIEGPPLLEHVRRFPMAMPQYPVGFRRRLETLQRLVEDRSGLFLCGGAVGAVGIPDCVASAEEAES